MIDQFSFQRIHVHVVKFIDSLLQTPDIKIIEAPLHRSEMPNEIVLQDCAFCGVGGAKRAASRPESQWKACLWLAR
jgi:hypothetical protein